MEVLDKNKLVIKVDNFYTKKQCLNLLSSFNQDDFYVAPVRIAKDVFEMLPDIRNNSRIMYDDQEFANQLFLQMKDYLPKTHKGWKLHSLNERFRCYKYIEGQQFAPHYDGKYAPSIDLESKLTVLIYLSEDFENGNTTFFTDDEKLRFTIKPLTGQLVIFDHYQLHSGEKLSSGIKYVLRTEAMYSRF